MARITVEDCIDKFPSRFELVLVASQRARKLHSGEEPKVTKDNDKNTVIALREIADSSMTVEQMKENLIQEYQTVTISDEEDENLELETLNSEQEGAIPKNENNSEEVLVSNNLDSQVEEELSSLITSEEAEIEQQYEITDTVEDDSSNSQNEITDTIEDDSSNSQNEITDTVEDDSNSSQNLDNKSDLVEEIPE